MLWLPGLKENLNLVLRVVKAIDSKGNIQVERKTTNNIKRFASHDKNEK